MKKKLVYVFLILSIFSISIKSTFAQNSGDVFGGQEVRSIEGLSNANNGIIPCDPYSENSAEQCHPNKVITLIKTLAQVFIYIVVISLFVMLIISGIGYVYYGKSPAYLNKWKKWITNSIYALLLIIAVFGVVLGLLSALGMKSEVLNFLKQILAQQDFSLFTHSYAQSIPTENAGSNGEYTNFFPKQTIGTLILNTIQFLVNYIAAPALVLATIWAGFLFVKAQGNPQKLQDAKKFALRGVIGIAIAAAAAFAVRVALNTVNNVAKSVDTTANTQNNSSTATTTSTPDEGGD